MAKVGKRNRIKLWLVSGLIISAVAFGVTWAVQTTSDAVVKNIQVQISDQTLRKAVADVAAIEIGERISDLNLIAAASRIEQLPQVRSAEVTRGWPDRIVISVDLREPIGWFSIQNEIWYLDATGEKYQPKVVSPKSGLPKFSAGTDKLLLAATAAYFDLPAKIRAKLTEVTAPTISNIRFSLQNQVAIIWGSSDRGERKAEVLEVLLQRKAKTYDVSAPDLPTIKVK